MIVSIMLAIITIGAVSASEEIMTDDELTVNDIAEEPINDVAVDETVDELQSTDDEEVLSDLTSEDFKVNIHETFDLSDEDDVAISYYCPEGANGAICVYLDDNDFYSYYNYVDSDNAGYTIDITYFYENLSPKTYNVL